MTPINYIISISWLILINIAAFQTGSLALNSIIKKNNKELPFKVISLSLGFIILTYITLLLGFLQLYSSRIFFIIILILSLINIQNLKKIKPKFKLKSPRNKVEAISLIIIIITFILLILKSFEPKFLWDSLVYHLKIPIYYIEHGGIKAIPYFLYSNMPHNIEIFYTLILSNASFWAVKLWVLECLILVFLLFTWSAKKYFNSKSPYLSFLIILGGANLWQHLPYCYIEPVMSLFLLVQIFYLYLWFKTKEKTYIIIFAIFWAFLMACKYTLWLLTFPFLPIVLLFMQKNQFPIKKILITLSIITIIILSLLSPWLIKNYIYTKNPIYPNLNKVFPSPWWSDILAMQQNIYMSKNNKDIGQYIINAITLPYNLVFNSNKYESSSFSPLLLILFIISIFLIKRLNVLSKITLFFCLSSIFIWFIFPYSNQGRFLLPLLPIMGLCTITVQDKIIKNKILYLLLFIFSCSILIISSKEKLTTIEIPWSKETYKKSISQNTNYKVCDFLNKLKPDSKTFFFFDNRFLFLQRPYWADSQYSASTSMAIFRKSLNNKNFYNFLKNNKFTHIAINPYHGGVCYFNNKIKPVTDKQLYTQDMLKKEEIRLQSFFLKYCRKGGKIETLVIFELK